MKSLLSTPSGENLLQSLGELVGLRLAWVLLVSIWSMGLNAKEYNTPSGIPPEQRVKVDKAIASSRNIKNTVDTGDGAIHSDGVTNTNCGEVSIGNVEIDGQKYGSKRIEVDRDVIVTGDVINLSTDCRRRAN